MANDKSSTRPKVPAPRRNERDASEELGEDTTFVKRNKRTGRPIRKSAGKKEMPPGYVKTEEAMRMMSCQKKISMRASMFLGRNLSVLRHHHLLRCPQSLQTTFHSQTRPQAHPFHLRRLKGSL